MSTRTAAYLLSGLVLAASCRTPGRSGGSAHPTTMQTANPTKPTPPHGSPLLREILSAPGSGFGEVFRNPSKYNFQVVYTPIRPDGKGGMTFTDHTFNLDPGNYFYPASTVKMPVAILALQRLRELDVPGLDRNSTMTTEAAYSGQTPVYNDPTAPDGRPTIAHYIKKILLVSDNDAYNRLYEFLGPAYINRELQKRGYTEAEIIHRLEISLTEDENRHTNPVVFSDSTGRVLYRQAAAHHRGPYATRSEKLGLGYMKAGRKVEGPMDFSRKNRISLLSLHRILQSVMFPESVPASARFNLSEDDLRFLREFMSATPSSVGNPPYDRKTYYDTYCKFLYFGSDPAQSIPADMKVYNKVGDAYGHLLDIACFEDLKTGSSFLLSAVVYCNSDGILNDNRYDYDSLGFPLLKEIGRRIFEHGRRASLQGR
jgi:hypothetical protein